jgi:hypothetical protein
MAGNRSGAPWHRLERLQYIMGVGCAASGLRRPESAAEAYRQVRTLKKPPNRDFSSMTVFMRVKFYSRCSDRRSSIGSMKEQDPKEIAKSRRASAIW